jgi:hypothetical protein
MRRPSILLCLSCAVLTLTMLSGCTSHLRNKQLENVAKDWSYVVRASQVVPVYPLTEDLQPGDVLLVSTPIDEQQKLYNMKGFLPLDQLVKRLNPLDYKEFYLLRYGTADGKIPPAKWQEIITEGSMKKTQWELAPSATFPSYNFEVSTGAGMNLAIPIQGVPIALGLMNSGKAKGSVIIGKAYTYGLDNAILKARVDEWAALNREMLRWYKPVEDKNGKKRQHFLRVVSRVYAISDINVTVQNDESNSGELGVGANKEVLLPVLKDKSATQNYQDALSVFNNLLNDQLPGGKVKVATASSRSVTLNEHFDRPLVLGYVGFDLPILEGGRLGAPISTLAQLTDLPILPSDAGNNMYRLAAFAHLERALRDFPGPKADEIRKNLDNLGALLPETYPFTLYEFSSPTEVSKSKEVMSGAKVAKRDFRGVLDYLGYGTKTAETLERYLTQAKVDVAARSVLESDLRSAREAVDKVNLVFGSQSALAQAVDFVFLGY